MTCEFTLDDGAYVLGALNPAERAAFERHLPACTTCREAVATLAVLPGLLGRLDAATAAPALIAPPSLLSRTLAAATARRRADRRRRIWYGLAGGLAAATLAAVVGAGVHAIDGTPAAAATPTGLSQMRPIGTGEVRVTAQVGLVATEGGTRINMTCRYASGYEGKWLIRLVVYPRWGGTGDQVGTWTAVAGQVLSLSGVTYLSPGEIDHVELQRADSTPLLTWTHA